MTSYELFALIELVPLFFVALALFNLMMDRIEEEGD